MRSGRDTHRIYINGRFLEQPLSGVQRYAHEMVIAIDRLLASQDCSNEHWCLLSTGRESQTPELKNIEFRRVGSRFKGHAWEQFSLAQAASDGALIGLGGSGPLAHSQQLVIIHDASVFRHPEFFSTTYGLWHRFMGRMLAKRARVGTVSHFSRQELAETLGLNSDRIPVLYNGSDHMVRASSSPEAVDRYELRKQPYFVLLGNLTRNKNVAVAVQALANVPHAKLVLVGGLDARVFAGPDFNSANERLVLAGRLSDASIAGLLRDATALIFPSLYEGFGIPPLEAMVRNCPVIASDIPPVREVCGKAARYFNPLDAGDLEGCMRECLAEDESKRRERVVRGAERAATFTWEKSAMRLLELCRQEFLSGTQTR